jgi:hypothetical protein
MKKLILSLTFLISFSSSVFAENSSTDDSNKYICDGACISYSSEFIQEIYKKNHESKTHKSNFNKYSCYGPCS